MHSSLIKPRFPLRFLALITFLMVAYYSLPEIWIENIIVRFFAVVPGATLLEWLTPGHTVTSEGTKIISSLARLNVLKGCEGTEVLLILYAAILAMGRPLKHTLWALLLGTLLVFALNQVRITALFFVVAYARDWFEATHGFIAPLLLVMFTGIGFFCWLQVGQPSATESSESDGNHA